MENKRTSFPAINIIVSMLLVAYVAWRTYMVFMGDYKILAYILFALSFDLIAGIQVLLVALSMGKRDKYPEQNLSPLVVYNIFLLVLFGLFLLVFHIVLVIKILHFFGL